MFTKPNLIYYPPPTRVYPPSPDTSERLRVSYFSLVRLFFSRSRKVLLLCRTVSGTLPFPIPQTPVTRPRVSFFFQLEHQSGSSLSRTGRDHLRDLKEDTHRPPPGGLVNLWFLSEGSDAVRQGSVPTRTSSFPLITSGGTFRKSIGV